jgi:tetratricopeptide (TPR) repeat protein
VFIAVAGLSAVALAAEDERPILSNEALLDLFGASAPAQRRAPSLDPKRIVNQSNAFLKEREPDMTAEELAIYDKVESLLNTNAELAIGMLESMMSAKEPQSPAFEFILGNAYYSAGKIEIAERSYRSTVKRFPTFLRAWDNLGILYYTSSRFPEAIECFAKALALGDRDQATYGLLAYCLERQGDLVGAEMAYLNAVAASPTNADWKEGLLRIYVDTRQYGRAEPLARTLIKVQPTETRFWSELARIYLFEGRKTEAMIVLEECASAGAATAEEYLLLGDLYAEQNVVAGAIANYAKVPLASRNRSVDRLLVFARALVAAGRFAEADEVLAAAPTEVSAAQRITLLQARADLEAGRHHWPDARRHIEVLLAIEPLNGRALLTLGRTYLGEQSLDRAAIAFESASRIPASARQAHVELANLALNDRHYEKAASYLEKALALEKNDGLADALARIKALIPRDPN